MSDWEDLDDQEPVVLQKANEEFQEIKIKEKAQPVVQEKTNHKAKEEVKQVEIKTEEQIRQEIEDNQKNLVSEIFGSSEGQNYTKLTKESIQ